MSKVGGFDHRSAKTPQDAVVNFDFLSNISLMKLVFLTLLYHDILMVQALLHWVLKQEF